MVVAASSLALGIAPVLGGRLIRAIGIRAVLMTALSVYGFAGLTPVVPISLLLLLLSRLALGIAGALMLSSGLAILFATFEGGSRKSMLALQAAMGAGVAFLLTAFSGYIAQYWSWHAAFLIYGLASFALLFALVAMPLLPEREIGPPMDAAPGEIVVLRMICGPLFLLMAITTLTSMNYLQGPFLLADAGVVNSSTVALVVGLSSLANAGGSLYFPLCSRTIGDRLLPLILLLIAVGACLWSMAHGPWVAATACLLIGVANGLFTPFMTMRIIEGVSIEARPVAGGLFYSGLFLAQFANPFLAAPLRAMAGSRGLFLAAAIAAVLSLILTLRAGRRPSTLRA